MDTVISTSPYPAWVISYWAEASLLVELKKKWATSELFLLKHRGTFKSSDKQNTCNYVFQLLDSIPWSGEISGFISGGATETLVTYLSQDWLSSVHITQNNDLLRLDLTREGNDMLHEVVEDHFFTLLERFYKDRDIVEYSSKGSSCYHWNAGQELALGLCKRLWGVANVGNHWVAIGIDGVQKKILYGDSLADPNSDIVEENSVLLDALTWWTKTHTNAEYTRSRLPITCQNDPFSCGVLALNAISASIFPDSVSLLRESEAITERIRMLIRILHRDIEMVCRLFTHYE
ncbi:hypothetical protein BDQ17DRAFT_1255480 [Cyathus striatus]|nr:hypothetical protein BDQ17DRAFT_1255480 [Cyathus striatus]